MKTKRSFSFRSLVLIAPLLAGADLSAAPLAWYPGPSLDTPISGAATTVFHSLGNVLIGGDAFTYPLNLASTNSSWTFLAPLYSLNIAPGAVEDAGLIVLYGGTDGISATNGVFGYDPSGDPPLVLASMSVARSYLGYARDPGGKAYAIGGLDDTGQALSSAERYDSDVDQWSAIAPMPFPRFNFPAVFDGFYSIYIFGGRTNGAFETETPSVNAYSIKANHWTGMAPMPVAVAGSAAARAPDGKFYVVGGVSGGVTTNVVQVYDPAANSWTISTALPEGLSASAMGVDSLGRLLVMGGMDANGNDVSDVWRSQQFGLPDSAPVFTQYPATNGHYQVPYQSSINATGNPPPLYLLSSGPSGMQVDIYSGAITWTPQAYQIGTNSVTIRATNYPGFADWNFIITVPYPPPVPVTGLAVVSVTDDSVSLAWDAEDPIVGPVTYSVWLRHVLHDPRGSGDTVWYTQIGTNSTVPAITIAGLAPGTSQAYYVVANGSGDSSGTNSAIVATTTAPQGPTALFLTGLTSTSVSLAWNPSPGPAQDSNYSAIVSYTIMERIASPPANIATVTGITGTSGTVTGLTPGSSHIWFVSGVDAQGYGSSIGAVYVVVTNPVPVAPLLSGATRLSNGNFQFTVQEQGPVVQTVVIQANTNPANPAGWMQLGSLLPAGSVFTFTDTNATLFKKRFYRVFAP